MEDYDSLQKTHDLLVAEHTELKAKLQDKELVDIQYSQQKFLSPRSVSGTL